MDRSDQRLELTYGGLLYWDRTLALHTRDVEPEGVRLAYHVNEAAPALFEQQINEQTYDVCEMSVSSYLILASRSDDRFIGLPVFLSRNFRHSQVYVHTDSGIERPVDLRGRCVGVLDYQMTAALWIRAFLQHDYGVAPTQIQWRIGGLRTPKWVERLPVKLPDDLQIERIPSDETLEGLLATGALDALVTAQPPASFNATETGPVRRLFPDYERLERDYYTRTGFFPIMHMVVVRRSLYERHPWVAAALIRAFSQAKEIGQRRLRAVTGLAVGIPWLPVAIEEVDRLFDGDAFPYGLEANREIINAMATYAHEQGLTERQMAAEELFVT